MDDYCRSILKRKFTLCVLLLNVVIFSLAVAVSIFLIVDNNYSYKYPVVIGSMVICILSSIAFLYHYKKTKTWLNIHGTIKSKTKEQ